MVSHSATAILLLTIAVLSSSCMAVNILYSGEVLNTGSSIQYGCYWLIMQQDCNLVLYDNSIRIWASNTVGLATNCYCTLQSNGNLTVYDPYGKSIWGSDTAQSWGHYVLVLQPDGNLVIYGPAIWDTAATIENARLGITPIIATTGTNNTTASELLSIATNGTNNTTARKLLSSTI